MSENKVVWHPYPQEKPKENKTYLVTLRRLTMGGYQFKIGIYRAFNEDFFNEDLCKVIAWAEMPEPYKEEQ